MRPLTDRDLRKIAASARPGVLLRQILRSRTKVAKRQRFIEAPYQRPLRIVMPRPVGAGLRETDWVVCRMGGLLLARACLVMRSRVWPSGKRKGRPMRLECVGCPFGAEYARRLPGFIPPPPSQPTEVLSPEQRAARAKWKSTHETTDEVLQQGTLSPLTEAAMCSPDDESDWRS